MTIVDEPVLDPRPYRKPAVLTLARRPSMEALRGGPVLFFDNTKLAFCNYAAVFERLRERLAAVGVTHIVEHCETVRGRTTHQLNELATRLAQGEPVAAVVALGDMGMAPATTVLTIALEAAGIPSVFITAPPGSDLARAVAHFRAGRLCLSEIELSPAASAEEVRQRTDCLFPGILDALTLSPEGIVERAALDLPLDTRPPSPDGFLDVPAADVETVSAAFNALHIGDGLPVVPPTPSRYRRMLDFCPFDPGDVLAREIGPTGNDLTVRDVAIGAVMAGCTAGALPILLTAFRAMADGRYNLLQSVTTAYPGGNLVLVSGPLAVELGIHGGPGCLGPGFPANATIGRAVNLTLTNVCRAVPGLSDLAGQSSPAEFSYCFAEDPALSPWPTVNAERYSAQTTTVTVLKAEVPHDITDLLSPTAEDLLETLLDCCTTLGSNNAYAPGSLILVLSPDHAAILAGDGWDKPRLRAAIHADARHAAARVQNRGIVPVQPDGFAGCDPIPVTRSAADVEIVVAGARGGHSAVILPWALHSEAVIAPVLLPDGRVPHSLDDFKRRDGPG